MTIPIGVHGKLWKKVTPADVAEWQRLADEGLSFREIGRVCGREHSTIRRHIRKPDTPPLKPKIKRKRGPAPRTFSVVIFRALSMARRRSRQKKLPMDIDMKFIKNLFDAQGGMCAVTGLPMTIEKTFDGLHQPYAPSIDRIDSKKGYTSDNVRLTLWIVNHALGEWGEDHFRVIAEAYVSKHAVEMSGEEDAV